MPTRPTELRLAMMQVPPSVSTRSWRRRISSRSPVTLKANITFLPGAVGVAVDDRHHRPGALLERAVRPVGLQLVVLDEIDAASGEDLDQRRGALRGQADARLDDGADQRPGRDARQAAGAVDAELRALVARGEGLAAGRCRGCGGRRTAAARRGCRRRWRRGWAATGRDCRAARTARPRSGDRPAPPSPPAGWASATSSSGSRRSTRAPARAFSSGVSPGTATKVPDDCSPAITSTARRGSSAVSIR